MSIFYCCALLILRNWLWLISVSNVSANSFVWSLRNPLKYHIKCWSNHLEAMLTTGLNALKNAEHRLTIISVQNGRQLAWSLENAILHLNYSMGRARRISSDELNMTWIAALIIQVPLTKNKWQLLLIPHIYPTSPLVTVLFPRVKINGKG